jgi:hypothetical protein
MGILWRLLAPKPLKKARRSVRKAAHPVRTASWALSPKPVKQIRRGAFKVGHPLEAAEFAVENQIVGAVRGGKRRPSARKQTAAPRSTGAIQGYGKQPVNVTWIPGTHKIPVVGLGHYTAAVRDTVKAAPADGIMAALLLPEPSNPHDPNAIAVYMAGGLVGHVPRHTAEVLQPALMSMSASHGGRPAGCPSVASAAGGMTRIVLTIDLRALGIDPGSLGFS